MAWLSSVSWVSGDTPVLATVLNSIGADIRTWGANVDAAGYRLANCPGLDGATLVTINTGGVERVRVNATGAGFGTDTPTQLIHASGGNGTRMGVQVNSNTSGYDGGIAFKITGDGSANYWKGGIFARSTADSAGRSDIVIAVRTSADSTNATSADAAITVQGTTGRVKIHVIPTYASNAAAISGGLTAGYLYTDGAGAVKVVF